jgi:hypothetical protein
MSSSFLLVPARFVLIILFNYILSQGFFFSNIMYKEFD